MRPPFDLANSNVKCTKKAGIMMIPICVSFQSMSHWEGFVFAPINTPPVPHINALIQNIIQVICMSVLFLYDIKTITILRLVMAMTSPVREKNVIRLSYHILFQIAILLQKCFDC